VRLRARGGAQLRRDARRGRFRRDLPQHRHLRQAGARAVAPLLRRAVQESLLARAVRSRRGGRGARAGRGGRAHPLRGRVRPPAEAARVRRFPRPAVDGDAQAAHPRARRLRRDRPRRRGRVGGVERQGHRPGRHRHRPGLLRLPFLNTPQSAPAPGTRERIKGAVRLGYEPVRKMRFELQGQIATLDDPMYADTMRRDASVWLRWQWWATNELRLQARARYANQALDTSSYLEDTVWAYLDVIYRIPRSLRLRARYDIISYVDNRASTMVRHPNPEHWLRLEVQGNF